MELTAAVVDDAVREYPDRQPLAAVEAEHVDLLPGTFAGGDYGWRDAEWVVQWYFRRFLGEVPNADRRAVEDAYGENDFDDVLDAIAAAIETEDAAAKLDHLTALRGVDVPVASAFLQFLDPERYLAIDHRAWTVLREAGEVEDEYPESPTAADYERFLAACRTVADRCDRSLWDLYRAFWVLGAEDDSG